LVGLRVASGRAPGLSHSERFEVLATSRKSVLVVSHDASRTGAPILCLNIARELRTKYNVVTLLLGGGSLVEEFRRNSDVVLGPVSDWANQLSLSLTLDKLLAKLNFTFAIVNSIESRTVLPSLATGFCAVNYADPRICGVYKTEGRVSLSSPVVYPVVFSTSLTRDEASSEQLELIAMPSIFFVRAGALQPSKKERTPHLSEKRLESSKRFDLSICQRTWLSFWEWDQFN